MPVQRQFNAMFPLARFSPWLRSTLALVPTVLVFVIRPMLPTAFIQTPAALHYPTVLLGAWLGGFWPGLAATLVGTAYSLFFVRPHLIASPFSDPTGLIRSGMFLWTSLLFVALIAWLRRSLERTLLALSARDDFMALAAHELKTPLTSLKLRTQIARRTLKESPAEPIASERVQRMVDTFDVQIQRLEWLVADMLDFTAFERGETKLQREAADLAELARRAADGLEPIAQSAGSLVTVIAPHPVRAAWDAHRVQQLIANLLGNAIKYGRGKPITLEVGQAESFARVSVRDQGIGIDPTDHARIFGKFERATSDLQFQGLGLGLFLSRRIVDLHGGRIWVESARDAGTCFTFELPVMPAQTNAQSEEGDAVDEKL